MATVLQATAKTTKGRIQDSIIVKVNRGLMPLTIEELQYDHEGSDSNGWQVCPSYIKEPLLLRSLLIFACRWPCRHALWIWRRGRRHECACLIAWELLLAIIVSSCSPRIFEPAPVPGLSWLEAYSTTSEVCLLFFQSIVLFFQFTVWSHMDDWIDSTGWNPAVGSSTLELQICCWWAHIIICRAFTFEGFVRPSGRV